MGIFDTLPYVLARHTTFIFNSYYICDIKIITFTADSGS